MAVTAPATETTPRADVLPLGEAQPPSRTSSIHSHLSDGSREALGISRCESFSNSPMKLTRPSSYESLDAIRRSFVWHPRMTLAERLVFERAVQEEARRSYADSEGCLEYAPKARALRVSPAALLADPSRSPTWLDRLENFVACGCSSDTVPGQQPSCWDCYVYC